MKKKRGRRRLFSYAFWKVIFFPILYRPRLDKTKQFVLGVIKKLLQMQILGEFASVIIELPIEKSCHNLTKTIFSSSRAGKKFNESVGPG